MLYFKKKTIKFDLADTFRAVFGFRRHCFGRRRHDKASAGQHAKAAFLKAEHRKDENNRLSIMFYYCLVMLASKRIWRCFRFSGRKRFEFICALHLRDKEEMRSSFKMKTEPTFMNDRLVVGGRSHAPSATTPRHGRLPPPTSYALQKRLLIIFDTFFRSYFYMFFVAIPLKNAKPII